MKHFYNLLKSLVLITCVFMAAGAQKSWAVAGTATIKKTITSPDDVTITSLSGNVTKVEFNAVDENGGSWAITLQYASNFTLNTTYTLFYYTGKHAETNADVSNGTVKVGSSQKISINETTVSTDDDNEYFHITGNIKLNTSSNSNKSGYAYLDLDLEYNVAGATEPEFTKNYIFTNPNLDDMLVYGEEGRTYWQYTLSDNNSNSVTLRYDGEVFNGEKTEKSPYNATATWTLAGVDVAVTTSALSFTVVGTSDNFEIRNGSFTTLGGQKVSFSTSLGTVFQTEFPFANDAEFNLSFVNDGWMLDVTDNTNNYTAHFKKAAQFTAVGSVTEFAEATFNDGTSDQSLTVNSFEIVNNGGIYSFNINCSISGIDGSSVTMSNSNVEVVYPDLLITPAAITTGFSYPDLTLNLWEENGEHPFATVKIETYTDYTYMDGEYECIAAESTIYGLRPASLTANIVGNIKDGNGKCVITLSGQFQYESFADITYTGIQIIDVASDNAKPSIVGDNWQMNAINGSSLLSINVDKAGFAGNYTQSNSSVSYASNQFDNVQFTITGTPTHYNLRGYGYLQTSGNRVNFNTSYDFTGTDITISPAGYATYYNEFDAVTLPAGVEGYVAYIDNEAFCFEHVYGNGKGDVIPAGTAIVLKGNARAYTLTCAAEDGVAPTNNDLEGSPISGITAAEMASGEYESGYKFYALALDNETNDPESIGFYWLAADGGAFALEAGKAYLPVADNGNTLARGFSFNDALGISDIKAEKEAGVMYNVYGQRVKEAKGLVVREGKMMFVK